MIDFEKQGGLVPAIIQDSTTRNVLMLGYMNQESYNKTLETGRVTFFSRSRQRLWTKGEESGNYLELVSIAEDCDNDTLLVKVIPHGPTCHTGTDTCWGEKNDSNPLLFLSELQDVVEQRHRDMPEGSYTTLLFNKGVKNICLGIGLAIFLGIWMGDFGVGIGILVACIGIGELLVDYFAKK